MSASSRLSALDGLRGVAALVVVIHHCLLVSPSFASAYYGGQRTHNPFVFAVSYTPLHLVWGGAEAVVVFFVLSGFVLARAIRSRAFDWFAYFPSRVLRLYVPVLLAIGFAYGILLLPHDGATDSPWLDGRVSGYPVHAMLQDATLVGGTSGVVSPLWTLRWEVLFSLLLPIAAFAARLIPAWLLAAVCVVTSVVGAYEGVAVLQYLPIFGVGVAVEGMWGGIGRAVERATRRVGWLVWTALILVAIGLLSMHWTLLLPLGHEAAVTLSQGPIVIGAGLLVVIAVYCRPVRRVLTWKPVVWLGAVSFSLYLIHEPIVILMANITNAMPWTLLTAVPLALLAAWAFWLIAEHPSHRLARHVRARAAESSRAGRTLTEPGPAVPPADADRREPARV